MQSSPKLLCISYGNRPTGWNVKINYSDIVLRAFSSSAKHQACCKPSLAQGIGHRPLQPVSNRYRWLWCYGHEQPRLLFSFATTNPLCEWRPQRRIAHTHVRTIRHLSSRFFGHRPSPPSDNVGAAVKCISRLRRRRWIAPSYRYVEPRPDQRTMVKEDEHVTGHLLSTLSLNAETNLFELDWKCVRNASINSFSVFETKVNVSNGIWEPSKSRRLMVERIYTLVYVNVRGWKGRYRYF